MLDSLFPHGNIVVFLMLCVLFLMGMVFGVIAKDGEYKSRWQIITQILFGIFMSFWLYHIIGTFTFQ